MRETFRKYREACFHVGALQRHFLQEICLRTFSNISRIFPKYFRYVLQLQQRLFGYLLWDVSMMVGHVKN